MFGQFAIHSNRFSTIDVTQEEWDSTYSDGRIVVISDNRYRSVRGIMFQIMEDVEELELLFK